MPIIFECPRCGAQFRNIKRSFLGKRVQCHCGCIIRLGPKTDDADVVVQAIADDDSAEDDEEFRRRLLADSDSDTEHFIDSKGPVPPPPLLGKAGRHRATPLPDDVWNTRNIGFDLGPPGSRHVVEPRDDGLANLQRLTPNETPAPSSSHSSEIVDVEPVDLAHLPSFPASPISPPPRYSSTSFSSTQRPSGKSSQAALVVVANVAALVQCFLLTILMVVLLANLGNSVSEWNNQGTTIPFLPQIYLRMVIGGVLLLGTVGFAIFQVWSLLAANEELAERGARVRPATSLNLATSAGVYLVVLAGVCLMGTYTIGNADALAAAESLRGTYWPKTGAEWMVWALGMMLIPLLVFLVGIFRVLDNGTGAD